jgi:hypothetical protein
MLFAVATLFAAGSALVACDSDDNTTATPVRDAGRDSTVSNDSGALDSGGDDARGDAGEAGAQLTCAFYCNQIMANCSAANAQYGSQADCLKACAAFPLGTLADTQGNTLGCRIYHSGAPSVAAPATHCPHGGPYGFGGCGTQCEGFCEVAAAACGADAGLFTDGGCAAECATWTSGDAGPDPAGPALQCREYHLGMALSTPFPHCTHIGTTPAGAACPAQ